MFFIQLDIDWHLGCSHILATVPNAGLGKS